MGLDISVLITDWTRIDQVPPEERYTLLEDALDALIEPWAEDGGPGIMPRRAGLVWPEREQDRWYAEYEFHNTSGSYKAHFWAGHSWDYLRQDVEPELKTGFDAFLGRLVSCAPNDECQHVEEGLVPPAERFDRPRLLVGWGPPTVRTPARTWAEIEPRIGELRGPFDEHAADPGRWCGTFEEFAAVVGEWGVVVTEAASRDWGVVGLPT